MSSRPGSLVGAVLLSLLLLPVASARGQVLEDVIRYSDRLPATGSPSMGMAGAGLYAGTEHPSALFGNPAGLGWLSTSMLGGDFVVQRTRTDARITTPDASASADRTVNDYQLGSLGGAYSFPTRRGSLVLGLSLHQSNSYDRGFDVTGENASNSITGTFLPAGFEVDGDELVFDDERSRIAYEAGAIDFSRSVFDNGEYPFFPAANPRADAVAGQMRLDQQENVFESGQMSELSFGAGVEVAPGIMLGGGVNVTFGSYTFERFYRETDASDLLPPEDPSNPQRPYDPYFVEGTDFEGFRELQLEERIEADISGVNLRTGLSAQVSPSLRAGLLIESPTWYNLTEVFGTLIRTDFDCDFSRSGSPCPVGGVAGLEEGSLTANEFDYRIRTPWRIGAGLQYAVARLKVAGDVEFVDWTQAKVSADDASFTALNRQIQGLDATLNTRLGAEYAFDVASVRAGFSYRPDPRDEPSRDGERNPIEGDRLFLSAGASYRASENFAVHVSWTQERFDDSFASYADGPEVRESLSRNRFLVGVSFRP